MSEDRVDKLEALLQRVRRNASSPRVSVAPSNGSGATHVLDAASEPVVTTSGYVSMDDPELGVGEELAPDSPRTGSRATILLASSIPPPVADEADVEYDDDDDDADSGQSTAVRRFEPEGFAAESFDIGGDAAVEPPISRSPSSLPSVPPAQVHSKPSPLVQAVVDHAEAQSLDGPDSHFNLMPPPPRLPPISLPSANPEVFGAQARLASDATPPDAYSPAAYPSSRPPPPIAPVPVATSPLAVSVSPSAPPSSFPPPAGERGSRIELDDLEGSLRPSAPSAPPAHLAPSEPPATTNEPASLALSAPEEVVDVDDEAELYDEPSDLVVPSRLADDDAAGVAVTRVPPPRSLLSFEESSPRDTADDEASDVREVSTRPPPSQNETVDVADVDAIERELLASRPIDLEQIETPIPSDRAAASTGHVFEEEETNAFGGREDDARAGSEPRTLPPTPGVDTDEHAPASARKPRETGRPPEDPLPGFEELAEPPPESGEVPSEAAARLAEARDAEAREADEHELGRDDVASDRPTPRPSPPPYDDPMAERTAEVTAMGRVDIVDRSTLSQDIVVAMVSGGFRTASETFGEALAEALSFGE